MNAYEEEGYNAYIRVLMAYGQVRYQDAMSSCPYPLSIRDSRRKQWMDGWQKAREDA